MKSTDLDVTKAIHDEYNKYVVNARVHNEEIMTYEEWFNKVKFEAIKEMNKKHNIA
jgi:hypothetical protein